MTRARLFVLIEALEEDLRAALTRWVIDEIGETRALGEYLPEARERLLSDAASDAESHAVDYLYLQDAVSLLNRHRDRLPAEVGELVRAHTPRLDQLAPIRNRVMHGRPLHSGDAEQVIRIGNDLIAGGADLPHLRELLDRLNADPGWEPTYLPPTPLRERIIHSLPLADFDETGFLGRGKETKAVLGFLLSKRHDVITIVGEGGVGKTALAVKVLYDLIDHPDCPYQAVLWSSLKSERLTVEGIEVLTDAARGIPGATRALAAPFESEFDGSIEELGELLTGTTTLVAIDNLETADSDDIVRIYDAMPAETRFLFTSRIGLGQLERRVPLGAMDEPTASRMFRQLARQRHIEHLASLPEPRVADVVNALRRNPLAIRWYVQSIEAGYQPDLAIENQDVLLQFCVESVFKSLREDGQSLLLDMFCLNRPVSYSELAVLTDLELDRLRGALHDLQRASLIDVEAVGGDRLLQGFSLTTSVRQYIARISPPDEQRADKMRGRDRELRTKEERRQRSASRDALAPHVCYTRSEADVPVATLLTEALELAHSNDEAWRDRVATAEHLAPGFYEVHRVAAFIESARGNVDRATNLYYKALEQAEDEFKGLVAYFLGGHFARAAKDPAAALPFSRQAHEELNIPRATLQYGLALMYLEEFEPARELFESVAAQSEGRTRLIAITQLVSLERRRAEWLVDQERNPLAGFHAALAGAKLGLRELAAGVTDSRLAETVVHAISEAFLVASAITDLSEVEEELKELAQVLRANEPNWRRLDIWPQAQAHLQRLLRREDLHSGVREAIVGDDDAPALDVGVRGEAQILRFVGAKGFGFARPSQSALLEIFVPSRALRHPTDRVFLCPGAAIEFTLTEAPKGPCASDITVPKGAKQAILARLREGEVTAVDDTYAFVREAESGASVFFPRDGLRRVTDWRKVQPGANIQFLLEESTRGPKIKRGSAGIVPPS